MSSINNLEDRVKKLERRRGRGKPVVFIVVHFIGSDNAGNREVLTPEEEAVLQKHKEETVAAAKTGERFVVVFWTKVKAQELLAHAEKSDAQDPTTTA